MAVADVVQVADLQRQLVHGEAWHEHLHQRRVFHGFHPVTARATQSGMQGDGLGK